MITITDPTSVRLNKTNSTINVGANDTLSATIAPTTATNKNVSDGQEAGTDGLGLRVEALRISTC